MVDTVRAILTDCFDAYSYFISIPFTIGNLEFTVSGLFKMFMGIVILIPFIHIIMAGGQSDE